MDKVLVFLSNGINFKITIVVVVLFVIGTAKAVLWFT